MALARAERADLAELLATLTPEQWNAPSRCTEWRVRDVVAHMFSYEELGPVALVRRFAAARFDGDGVNALGVADYAERSTDELLVRVHSHLQPSGLTARFGGRIALTDGLIHHQDIRRALGLPREVPADRLRAVVRVAPVAPPIRARRRIRGLTLTATDLQWSIGRGPIVTGPGEALLVAVAGRPAALWELSGPGLPILVERIGPEGSTEGSAGRRS